MDPTRQYDYIFRLLRDEGGESVRSVLIFATLSGAAGGTLLVLASQAAQLVVTVNEESFGLEFLRFAVFVGLFFTCKRLSFSIANQLLESIVARVRTRIVDKLRRTELRFIDDLDKHEVYTRLASDVGEISQGLMRLVNYFQDSLFMIFCLVNLAVISWIAVSLACAVLVSVIFIHTLGTPLMLRLRERQNQCEALLFGGLHSLFYGFKEVKLNALRHDAIIDEIDELSEHTKEFHIQGCRVIYGRMMLSEAAVYLMVGAAIFVLPQYAGVGGADLVKVVTLMVAMTWPMTTVSNALYFASHTNSRLMNLYDLEHQVDEELQREPPPSPPPDVSPFLQFEEITFEGLHFAYRDESDNATFAVGPLDLTLKRGETVFIIGGNGAGKSTTFKLLTGLYRPDEGRMLVDGKPVSWDQIRGFRQIATAIFADFHLFDQFYGIDPVDESRVAELLRFMKLEPKVTFSQGRFSTQDLSTGQRKRLAMITSLMEDRPLCFFDEWAADQDPPFREYFYRTILPELQRRGKTIVAITHDERYLDVADKIVEMDLGQLIEPRAS